MGNVVQESMMLDATPLIDSTDDDPRENEDDEDSDDDIDIVLDATAPENPNKPQSLVNIKPTQAPGAKAAKEEGEAAAATSSTTAKAGGIDINAVGQYEGKDILDVDLDSFDDKPWRKPGADITDYFNYGFNENTWKAYNNKQKQIREEMQMQKRIHVYEYMEHQEPQPFGMPIDMMDAAAKYQRMQRGNIFPPGMRELNSYGKRPREQDSIIQVAGGEGSDAQLEGGEDPGFQQQQDEFGGGHAGMYRGPGPGQGYGHMMPPQAFIPPEMGGPMPYDMYRRGPHPCGPYPPMGNRGMMRPPQQMRNFLPPGMLNNPPQKADGRDYRDRPRDEFGRDRAEDDRQRDRDHDNKRSADDDRWGRDRKKR